MKIDSLTYYPIKSCKGVSAAAVELGWRGLARDRELMLVDENGEFITQRTQPVMALIEPQFISDTCLHVEAPGMPPLAIPLVRQAKTIKVKVWGHESQAVDQGDEAARWFSRFLGTPCKLVFAGDEFKRTRTAAGGRNFDVVFADHYPLVLATRESLDFLNQHADHPMRMNRFRANVVVAGCQPFDESNWTEVRLGETRLAVAEDCGRCSVVAVEQETAALGKEPLRSLARLQVERPRAKVVFGIHLVPLSLGTLRVGDKVEVVRR